MGQSNTVTITVGTKLPYITIEWSPQNPRAGIVHLKSTLTYNSQPLSGKPVDFYVNGINVWTSTTNANGIAEVDVGLSAGTHSVYAKFNGDNEYESVMTMVYDIIVTKIPTILTITPSKTTIALNETLVIYAKLVDDTNAAVPTSTIKFYDGNSLIGTATTNSSGTASITVTFGGSGMHNIYARFDGNNYYEGC